MQDFLLAALEKSIVSAFGAVLTLWLYYLIRPGMIFFFYTKYFLRHIKNYAIAKPLGLCVICMNVWVNVALFASYSFLFNGTYWYFWAIPTFALSNFFVAWFLFNGYVPEKDSVEYLEEQNKQKKDALFDLMNTDNG